jgi:hypothetical protein
MVKAELEQKKACYGTNEWSLNSGICCNCKLQVECGKENPNNKLK